MKERKKEEGLNAFKELIIIMLMSVGRRGKRYSLIVARSIKKPSGEPFYFRQCSQGASRPEWQKAQ